MEEEWMNSEEVCAFLKIHRTTLWRYVKAGKLTAYRRPGEQNRVFRRHEVTRFAEPQPASNPEGESKE